MGDGTTSAGGAARRVLLLAAAVGLAAGAVGAFAGAWAWAGYTGWQQTRAAAAAASAAEAERATPKGRQREAVLRVLNDPDSAQFRNDRPSKKVEFWWCGEINARNRMGGFVGFRRYVAMVDPEAAPPGQPAIDSVSIDPADSDRTSLQQRMFETDYMAYCDTP